MFSNVNPTKDEATAISFVPKYTSYASISIYWGSVYKMSVIGSEVQGTF
jgi:hypothetical protein